MLEPVGFNDGAGRFQRGPGAVALVVADGEAAGEAVGVELGLQEREGVLVGAERCSGGAVVVPQVMAKPAMGSFWC